MQVEGAATPPSPRPQPSEIHGSAIEEYIFHLYILKKPLICEFKYADVRLEL